MADQFCKTLTHSPVIANGASASDAFDMREYLLGTITTPAALDATTRLGFSTCDTKTGTFVPVYAEVGTAAKTLLTLEVGTGGAENHPLPKELAGAFYVKLLACTAAGVAVNQTADRTFKVTLKA